ncbi:MAG: hypothetical protein LQ352_004683, partial [Teloschistes flavicans]
MATPPNINGPQRPFLLRPFHPVVLPPQWEAYPFSNLHVVRPITFAASTLEIFYNRVIAQCGQSLWSARRAATLLKWHLGAFCITVTGQKEREGLPWGVLALLVQGMLERAR